jgi:hypothetical protein
MAPLLALAASISAAAAAAAAASLLLLPAASGFELTTRPVPRAFRRRGSAGARCRGGGGGPAPLIARSSSQQHSQGDPDFSRFASSLLEDEEEGRSGSAPRMAAEAAPATSEDASMRSASTSASTRSPSSSASPSSASPSPPPPSWKRDLDELLDLATPAPRRQVLLQRLLSSPEDIRSSVEQALRDRKVRNKPTCAF